MLPRDLPRQVAQALRVLEEKVHDLGEGLPQPRRRSVLHQVGREHRGHLRGRRDGDLEHEAWGFIPPNFGLFHPLGLLGAELGSR